MVNFPKLDPRPWIQAFSKKLAEDHAFFLIERKMEAIRKIKEQIFFNGDC